MASVSICGLHADAFEVVAVFVVVTIDVHQIDRYYDKDRYHLKGIGM
jgi:hypothetical protein